MTYFHRTRGFALPSAIFLLVILSLLGGFIAHIFTAQQAGQALDIEGERAYQAAHAGMEWARFRVAAGSACPANTNWGSSATHLAFVGTNTLGNFGATVECRLLESTDVAGIATSVFELRVTACNRPVGGACPGNVGAFGYVERQMQGLVGI